MATMKYGDYPNRQKREDEEEDPRKRKKKNKYDNEVLKRRLSRGGGY
jgi:hypothetical protein